MMCLSPVTVTTSRSPRLRASSKCTRCPMWTRSNAPWHRTMVLSGCDARVRASSPTGTILLRAATSLTSAPPLQRRNQLERPEHIHEVLHAKRLALALLPLDQIHWDFD